MKLYLKRGCAFSLVEVTLALGIASFSLLAVFALLPTSLQTNQAALQQTADTTLAKAIAVDLRNASAGAASSARYGIPIPVTGNAMHTIFLHDDGTPAGNVDSDAVSSTNPIYRATIFFYPPAAPQRTATGVRIFLTWPALADKTAASAPTNFRGSYDVVTALDRN